MREKKIIQVDVNKCLANSIDFNEYVILSCIANNSEIPAIENLSNTLNSLLEKALIQQVGKKIELRPKAKKLFNIEDNIDLNVEDWVDEYRNLFPSGVHSGGYPVRGIKKTCIINLKKFMLEFGRDKKTILEATKIYVEKKQQENFNYMMLAHFFIYKNNNSMLEAFIENFESMEQDYNDQFHKTV
jgi:hypothetical protein